MSQKLNLTPLAGGKNDLAGICSILEIGQFTILLDCGCSLKNSFELLQKIKKYLSNVGKSIDAVILSHADLQHMGALPVVFNKKLGGLLNTNVICTLPVHKFGQLVLYDYCANTEMEGQIEQQQTAGDKTKKVLNYDYDDIDQALLHPTVVKFSQLIELKSTNISTFGSFNSTLSVCAYPSGRTIGGAIWRIRLGSTEILYAVDINMKNEVVLTGANINQLPSTPSLLITDACTSYQLTAVKSKIEDWQQSINKTKSATSTAATTAVIKKKKDVTKDDPNGLISTVLETLRNNGNALIPCETAGRSLEVIQLLANHWTNHKIGLYHLIFLSPMAENVIEFAKSQLEWMSEQLSKKFYNGGRNPFDFSVLKVCTSIYELERLYPGPKVVLSSDASMSCGLSKELLLLWGGDPRCNVIFTDLSDQHSLAYELRSQLPPIVVSVTRPVRVELVGEELAVYREVEEKRRKEVRESTNRRKREEELELLAQAGDDDEEEDTDNDDTSSLLLPLTPAVTRQHSVDTPTTTTATTTNTNKKRKLVGHSELLLKFAQPAFPMFESKDVLWAVDEFGCSNDDLVFRDVDPSAKYNTMRVNQASGAPSAAATQPVALDTATATTTLTQGKQQASTKTTGNHNNINTNNNNRSNNTNTTDATQAVIDIPTKVVSTTIKVQFTCTVSEIPLAGRADIKVAKFIISKLTPARIIVLRGSTHDCDSLVAHAHASHIHAVSPLNGETIKFSIEIDRIKLQIPISLFPKNDYWQQVSGVNSSMRNTMCALTKLAGAVVEVATRDQSGLRTLRLQPLPLIQATTATATAVSTVSTTGTGTATSAATTTLPTDGKLTKKKRDKKTAAITTASATITDMTTDVTAAAAAAAATDISKSESEPVTKKVAATAASKRKGKATATITATDTTTATAMDTTTDIKTDTDTTTTAINSVSPPVVAVAADSVVRIKIEKDSDITTTTTATTATAATDIANTTAADTTATTAVPVPVAVTEDLSSMDIDAFFNSMASQLVTATSATATATSAADTNTTSSNNGITTGANSNTSNSGGSGGSGGMLNVVTQQHPQSLGSIPSMHPPLAAVTCSYPDQYNDYDGLLPLVPLTPVNAVAAVRVSELIKGASSGIDDFHDENDDDATQQMLAKQEPHPTTDIIKHTNHNNNDNNSDNNSDINYDSDSDNDSDGEEDDEYAQTQLTLANAQSVAVSVGEITLNSIKLSLEKLGISVEFKMTAQGMSLLCDTQVIIRRKNEPSSQSSVLSSSTVTEVGVVAVVDTIDKKESVVSTTANAAASNNSGGVSGSNLNYFVVEGLPVRAFWEAKRLLSDKFAFI